jgi:hypothetical protein
MGVVATLAADELILACVSVLRLAANLAGVTEGPTLVGWGASRYTQHLQARRLRLVSLIGPTRAVRSACASRPRLSTSPSPRLAII